MTKRRKKTKRRRFNRAPKSTLELARLYPRAWKALPSPYRNDEALDYRIVNGNLTAEHKDYPGAHSVYKNGRWSK